MTSQNTPKHKAHAFVNESEDLADEMLSGMDSSQCVEMVRGFCSVIATWQTQIAATRDKPLEFSLHCLTVADLFKKAFVKALSKLIPEIKSEHLKSAPAGVRAQAVSLDGSMVDDFYFSRNGNILNVCNAPSPAATASLNIAKIITEKIAEG